MNKTSHHKPVPKQAARLGPLETHLLQIMWQRGSGTVREIVETGKVDGAYTTVMTTLDRLHKKGLLKREAEGRAFRYSPAQTEGEFNGAIVRNAIRQMLGAADSASAPLSFLVEAISEHDSALLDELKREIERKRRELDGEAKR
jgi:predicted transcriptional regulator